MEKFLRVTPAQKESTRRAWELFKQDPFDPRLGAHKIHSLSARYRKTVHSAVIEADLRVVFFLEGNTVRTVDIGTHALYR